MPTINVQMSGLDRTQVWFSKPTFVEATFSDPEELPYPGGKYEGGYQSETWKVVGSGRQPEQPVSLGEAFVFGPSEDDPEIIELKEYVWEKLVEHYGSEDIMDWDKREKDGFCRRKDFILEIDIHFGIKSGKWLSAGD